MQGSAIDRSLGNNCRQPSRLSKQVAGTSTLYNGVDPEKDWPKPLRCVTMTQLPIASIIQESLP